MPTRERALWKGQLVTILKRDKRIVTIRGQHGFVTQVKSSELQQLAEDDPRAKLQYGEND